MPIACDPGHWYEFGYEVARMSDSGACPHCAQPVEPADEFCEACGIGLTEAATAVLSAPADAPISRDPEAVARAVATLSETTQAQSTSGGVGAGVSSETARTSCAACGGAMADDGYCSECGAKGRSERDHWTEQPVPWVAGVCDRGVRHRRNEDAMALIAHEIPGSFAGIVVCDGVSTASNSDVASLGAARAARDILAGAPSPTSATVSARITHWTSAIESAAAAGHAFVCNTEITEHGNDLSEPACTFVAAVVDGAILTVGWVGDSRAYWFPDDGPAEALSIDHSVASDDIARGVARSVAEAGNMAHAITRWFGHDTPTAVPECITTTVASAGWLLLCSDGLWNYSSAPPDLAVVLKSCLAASSEAGASADDPLRVAARLTDWANAQGGHDNITVVLARIPNPTPAGAAALGA